MTYYENNKILKSMVNDDYTKIVNVISANKNFKKENWVKKFSWILKRAIPQLKYVGGNKLFFKSPKYNIDINFYENTIEVFEDSEGKGKPNTELVFACNTQDIEYFLDYMDGVKSVIDIECPNVSAKTKTSNPFNLYDVVEVQGEENKHFLVIGIKPFEVLLQHHYQNVGDMWVDIDKVSLVKQDDN